jgi:hypothetical protein
MEKGMDRLITVAIAAFLTVTAVACDDLPEDAAHIQLGTGNGIYTLNDTQYQLPLVVQVTDVDGNPAPDSLVRIRVVPTEYRKGQYIWLDDTLTPVFLLADAVSWGRLTSVVCPAEDTDLDGVLDTGEDTNTNGVLDPSNAATATAHPSNTPTLDPASNRITTNSSGFGYFTLTYPKSVANWVTVRVTASVSVSGTESTQTYDVNLVAVNTDMANVSVSPPGGSIESPYGVAAVCTDPN